MKAQRILISIVLVMVLLLLAAPPSRATGGPPQGTQTDAAYAGSYASNHVTNVTATTQRVSCYSPELPFTLQVYPDGGMTPCHGAATTGENLGPYPTQNVANPPMRVKDHSESDLRVDPTNAQHLIGQSKWFISAEGYNHLLGFYESYDGGQSWPIQGHVPGYEGWVDNTDPVGAFDPWGNFYSLVLPYQFYYDQNGGHKYDNGSNQINPTVPPEAVAVAVHPARPRQSQTATNWITTRNGQPDYLMTAPHANTSDPDKQWITIDTNPSSPYYGRIYAMWTLFVLNPSVIYESHADARPDGTHTDWTAPQVLPTVPGKRWDSYLLPHVAPDGSIWTTTTNNPSQQGFAYANISLIWSTDGGASWQGPRPVRQNISVPSYQNTTFREGIVNTFAVGVSRIGNNYPLYVSYEEGSTGLSIVYLTASYDGGQTWTSPIQVNDNAGPVDALQPNLTVAPGGTVAVAFYDRRLPCPTSGAEAANAGLALDTVNPNYAGTLPPYGAANYCVNTSVQFYNPTLTPQGHNIRLSAHTWDPQLNAPHTSCPTCFSTFIGDYFGVISNGPYLFTTSVSTFNDGTNPNYHLQQVIARLRLP
jgi:hypothetical protein